MKEDHPNQQLIVNIKAPFRFTGFLQLLDDYYELRGWDKTLGIPTREKLIQLGLRDVAEALPH